MPTVLKLLGMRFFIGHVNTNSMKTINKLWFDDERIYIETVRRNTKPAIAVLPTLAAGNKHTTFRMDSISLWSSLGKN